MSYDIKSMVKDGKVATFQYYRKNELWYKTECGFMFPVPVSDVGDGTFNAEEKAMLMMRYIRKQIAAHSTENDLLFVKNEHGRTDVYQNGEIVMQQG